MQPAQFAAKIMGVYSRGVHSRLCCADVLRRLRRGWCCFVGVALVFLLAACAGSQTQTATASSTPIRGPESPQSTPETNSQGIALQTPSGAQNQNSGTPPPLSGSQYAPAALDVGKDLYRVGVLLPLSGELRELGERMQKAMMLSLSDNNLRNIELRFYDTQGRVDVINHRLYELEQDRIDLVLGPLLGANVWPTMQRFSNKIVLSFSNDNAAIKEPGNPNHFLLGLDVYQQVNAIVTEAQRRGYHRLSLMTTQDLYGIRVHQALMDAIVDTEVEIVNVGYVEIGNEATAARHVTSFDLRAQALEAEKRKVIKAIYEERGLDFRGDPLEEDCVEGLPRENESIVKESEINEVVEGEQPLDVDVLEERNKEEKRPQTELELLLQTLHRRDTFGAPPHDAVLIALPSSLSVRNAAAQLAYHDNQGVRVLGMSLWQQFETLLEEPTLRGALYPGDYSKFQGEFSKRLRGVYAIPSWPILSLAYDAVILANTAVQAARSPGDALERVNGFEGVSGRFRLRHGKTPQRNLSTFQIQRQTPSLVRRAPDYFLPPRLQGSQ